MSLLVKSSPDGHRPEKKSSWISRRKDDAKASLQRLKSSSTDAAGLDGGNVLVQETFTDSAAGSMSKLQLGSRSSGAAVVIDVDGTGEDEKVKQAIGTAPTTRRVIVGAVKDQWQMYRYVALMDQARRWV